MTIETKNDFKFSVLLSAIWLLIGIVLLFTNFWVLGIVFAVCGVFSAITPVKYYIANKRAIPTDSIENLELDSKEN